MDVTANSTNKTINVEELEHEVSFINQNFLILAATVKLILCILDLIVDIILIYVFLRSPQIRTKPHIFVLYYTILNFIYISVGPLLLAYHDIFSVWMLEVFYFCIYLSAQNYSMIMSLVVAFLIRIVWYLQTLRHDVLKKYKQFYNFLIPIVFLVSLIPVIIVTSICRLYIMDLMIEICVWILTLCTIILHFIDHRKKLHKLKNYYLVRISTSTILVYLPLVSYYTFLVKVKWESYFIHELLSTCMYLMEYIYCSGPFIVLFILYRNNKYFNGILTGKFGNYGNMDGMTETEEQAEEVQNVP